MSSAKENSHFFQTPKGNEFKYNKQFTLNWDTKSKNIETLNGEQMGKLVMKQANDHMGFMTLSSMHKPKKHKRPDLLKESKELQQIINTKQENTTKLYKERFERRVEGKLISQATKNFNIYIHAQNLFKENSEYLSKCIGLIFCLAKLNQQVNK